MDAAAEALDRALVSLDGAPPSWCVVFASGEHAIGEPTLLSTIVARARTPYVVGCSAAGVLGEGRELEDGAAVGILAVASDTLRATPFRFLAGADDYGLTAGTRIGERFSASRGTSDLLVVWPDPFRVRPDRLLEGIDAVLPGVPVVGGAASSHRSEIPTRQFCGTEGGEDGVAGLRLAGQFGHRVVVSQGCRALCGPMRVTNAHENLILEIDGRPALEVLRDVAPDDLFSDPSKSMRFLAVGLLPESGASRPAGSEFLVRNIVAADPDTGLLAVAATVEEGQSLVFTLREPQAARDELVRSLAPLRAENGASPFRFGLYFDCMARGQSLYGCGGVDAGILAKALPQVPVLGFFCSAEMAPLGGANRFLTYSGVLLLVSD